MSAPEVSVYICTFNRAEMLRESIGSVLNQAYRDIKVVVLDNASADHTADVVSSFGDPRLSYVRHEENIGVFRNWNYALDHADTEYVCIFHDDDRMLPWMIAEEVEILERRSEVGLVASSNLYIMGSRCSVRRDASASNDRLFRQNELIEYACKTGLNPVVCPSVMFRKKSMDALALRFCPDVGAAADLYFWLEANSRGVVIYLSGQPFLEYRVHETSGTRDYRLPEWARTYKRIDDFILGLGLPYDTQRLREAFAAMVVSYCARALRAGGTLPQIRESWEALREELKWDIPDVVFDDAVAIGLFGDCVASVGRREASLVEYFRLRKEWADRGVRIPLKREMKWFVKYLIIQRLLRK